MLELRRPVLASLANNVTGSDATTRCRCGGPEPWSSTRNTRATLIEALRKLREAKGLVDHISEEIGDDGGKRERLLETR